MMNALKTPLFLRPASRPSSPAPTASPRPDTGVPFERAARPLNKLSLGGFRKSSPAPSISSAASPALLVQDGSYLEMLSLKLSEAVSKSLAQSPGPASATEQVAGRRPIPAGRGHALGSLIASELAATGDNGHLRRAILRSLLRPLSVLLSNLSAHLLPLLSSAAFTSPPAPTVQAPNPNPTQLHALAIAAFAGELLETFDEFGLGNDSDVRGDGLKVIREGLVSVVNRVVAPLIGGIRNEIMPLLEALEVPNSNTGAKTSAGTKSSVLHPSIVALQAIMPIYAKALARYTTSPSSQTMLAPFLISLVWRGFVALTHRPYVPPAPPSPGLIPTLPVKKRRGSPSSSPPLTPPSARFTMKLPPSRPPSPPSAQVAMASADARALYDLLNLLPRPSNDKEATRLAREAVDEAFDGLKALPPFLEAVHSVIPTTLLTDPAREHELEVLTAELPTLIALPVLLHAHGREGRTTSVADMLGLSEDEYRKGCLAGFGRAEQCADAVGQRVLAVLRQDGESNSVLSRWLEAEILLPELGQ